MKVLPGVLFLAAFTISSLQADSDFSFQGTFSTDDQVQLFDFTRVTDGLVTFQSYGYGGGTNASGTMIPPGGFDSLFSWFTSDGTLLGTSAPFGCGSAGSNNGACLDAFAQPFLTAGDYQFTLTTSQNTPNGDLNQGFARQGNGNFTCDLGFCDSFENQNNGYWAVDILNVASASPIPEPISPSLTGSGLAAIALVRRRARNVRV